MAQLELEDDGWYGTPYGRRRDFLTRSGVDTPYPHIKDTSYQAHSYSWQDHDVTKFSIRNETELPVIRSSDIAGFRSWNLVRQPTEAEIYSQLASKVQSSDFDLGMFAAESRESLRMILERTRSIMTSYRLVRKGKLQEAVRTFTKGRKDTKPDHKMTVKDVANAHLELKYGWVPLMRDIRSAMSFESNQSLETYKTGFDISPEIQPTSYTRYYGGLYFHIDVKGSVSAMNRYKLRLPAERVSNEYRLGLKDPATLLYDATPLSFVLDWFLPVSRQLKAIDFYVNFHNVATLSSSIRRSSNWTASFDSVESPFVRFGPGRVTFEEEFYDRTSPGSLSFPPLRPISLRDHIGDELDKTATLVALLVQRAKD